ncbi:AAEL005563-PA [Aedes aegypti]|uniref:AAEL005563-PA n=1 Tax=Aedes aegypti TaxID=7159 RepID=Q179K1_AEDAE|nr:AAEL005563-PA [Aedes aegypti]
MERKRPKVMRWEYPCQKCSAVFYTNKELMHHKAKIHGEHRFNCPVCSKAFHLKAKMLLHLRTHEKNNLKLIIIPADVPFPTCGAEVKPMQAEGLLESVKKFLAGLELP